jgi:hypothetical protein
MSNKGGKKRSCKNKHSKYSNKRKINKGGKKRSCKNKRSKYSNKRKYYI